MRIFLNILNFLVGENFLGLRFSAHGFPVNQYIWVYWICFKSLHCSGLQTEISSVENLFEEDISVSNFFLAKYSMSILFALESKVNYVNNYVNNVWALISHKELFFQFESERIIFCDSNIVSCDGLITWHMFDILAPSHTESFFCTTVLIKRTNYGKLLFGQGNTQRLLSSTFLLEEKFLFRSWRWVVQCFYLRRRFLIFQIHQMVDNCCCGCCCWLLWLLVYHQSFKS